MAQHHAILHHALEDALAERKIISNPAKAIKKKPKKSLPKDKFWNEEEVSKFLVTAFKYGVSCKALYGTAIETGMRKGELCGLKWEDIDINAGTITIQRTLIKSGLNPIESPTKNGLIRTVYISSELLELLKAHQTEQNKIKAELGSCYDDKGYVFTKKRSGRPLQINNFAQNEFKKLILEAGVRPIRFHDLRHTSATLRVTKGDDVKSIQTILGHKDASLTLNRYMHSNISALKKASHTMGSLIQ